MIGKCQDALAAKWSATRREKIIKEIWRTVQEEGFRLVWGPTPALIGAKVAVIGNCVKLLRERIDIDASWRGFTALFGKMQPYNGVPILPTGVSGMNYGPFPTFAFTPVNIYTSGWQLTALSAPDRKNTDTFSAKMTVKIPAAAAFRNESYHIYPEQSAARSGDRRLANWMLLSDPAGELCIL
ncbi:hypothetical protein TcasGA2_TC009910 [Tribolium castaneum]|uniref:Uncharacterized protein n=1 Tax=Tribolium castaneum TaxID=7070 RepID=D6WQD1_TRICA|nr:hypothetical protein TcasGA2_TC009910 [Tribolium castaneum]